MIDYALILTVNFTGTQWYIDGTDYTGLNWLDNSQKPTKDELDSLWESTLIAIESEKQAKITARQTAINKLMALGLTEEEALALGVK
jgi:hypothetical protein